VLVRILRTVNPLIAWLRQTFVLVPDVKQAFCEAEGHTIFQAHSADLVVDTWMGARLHVHLIRQTPKVRDLKATLKDNTARSVGTLFVVTPELLPAPAQGVKIEDWQEALWWLNDGWIYSYQLHDNGLRLIQVHMTPTPLAEHFDVWHMLDFAIESVAVRTRDLYQGLKGQWFIADIASVGYKRKINQERRNQRFHYQSKYTQQPKTHTIPSDRLAAYFDMLGVPADASERDVKSAFRRLAMRYHPDVSALPRQEAERLIKELLEAYEAIKDHYGWS